MLARYRTLRREGAREIVIKKSRFIGYGKPVTSEDEATSFIEAIRKKHWDATHNCYAYVIGERDEIQKSSDDGEPSGTAGRPILEVIKARQLKNTAIVVTRYFGGILLGAGGLIRAYTEGAVQAIEASEPVERVLRRKVAIEADYTWYGKIENELRSRGWHVGDTMFTDRVTVICLPEDGEAERFIAWMTDLTQGRATITPGEAEYYDF